MPSLQLPPDLAGEAIHVLQHEPEAPAVQRFLVLVRRGQGWDPYLPRALLRLVNHLDVTVEGPAYLTVLPTGFSTWSRPLRVVEASATIARAWLTRGRFYRGQVFVFEDPIRRRWGAPESVLRPSLAASPAGPLPPSAPEASTPSSTGPPAIDRGQWITLRLGYLPGSRLI